MGFRRHFFRRAKFAIRRIEKNFFLDLGLKGVMENFFSIAKSAVFVAAIDFNGIMTLLAHGASTFFVNGKPTFIKEPIKLSNPSS